MNAKEEMILQILNKESENAGFTLVSYKALNKKYNLEKNGITHHYFYQILTRLLKRGYISRIKKGYYTLTDKGKMYILARVTELSGWGGLSPEIVRMSNYFLGIRVHNIKIELGIKSLPEHLKKDMTKFETAYFTAQMFFRENQPFLLVHFKENVFGKTPTEVVSKLVNLLLNILIILKERGYLLDATKIWFKHFEWAYQFKFPKNLDHIVEQIKNYLISINDKIVFKWDRSLGLVEIETTDEIWAILFFMMPFLSLINYKLHLITINELLKAKPEELHKKIDELKELLGLKDKIDELENVMSGFAMQIETHLGVMKGIWGMLESLTAIKNQETYILKKLSDAIEKLNKKLN